MRVSKKETIYFYSSLAALLDAGVSVAEALENLKQSASKNLNTVLNSIITDINNGNDLSTALKKFPEVFDNISVSLIKTGEVSGNLSEVLSDIEKNKELEQDFSSKIKSALYYPLLIVIIFFVIFSVILFYVVPRISEVFLSLEITLPLATRVLFAMSNFAINYWYIILSLFFVLFISTYSYYYYNRSKIVNFILRLPVISKLGKNLDYMRFSSSFYIMLKSGIPIVEALNLSTLVVSRTDTIKALKDISSSVSSGNTLYSSFSEHKKVFPSFMLQVVSAAEKSGTFEKSFLKISKYFQKSFENQLKVTSSLFEPLILAVIGIIVAAVMLSIITPIYQVMGSISPY